MSEKNLPLAPAPFEATPALEQFMDKHFKTVLVVIAIIVVGLCGYAFIRYQSHQKEQEAGAAFVTAKTVADCDLVVQNYPGTEAAGNALLMKADLLWTENKKDSSTAALREFVTKYDKHPFLAEGILALGAKLDSMGERAEAKPLFERLVNDFADSAAAPLAQIRLGDLLWAEGKEDEAKKAYEAVPAKFSDANPEFFAQSEERVKLVEAKLPTKEVDGPPKPKAPEPVPGAPPAAVPGLIPPPKFNIPGLSPTPAMPGGTEPKVELTTPPGVPAPPSAPATPTPPSPLGTPGVTTPAPTLPAPKAPSPVAPSPPPPAAAPAASPTPPAPAVPAPAATPAPTPPAAPAPTPAPPPAPAPAPAAATPPPPAPAPAPAATLEPAPASAPAPKAP